jgi:hypothetical protein
MARHARPPLAAPQTHQLTGRAKVNAALFPVTASNVPRLDCANPPRPRRRRPATDTDCERHGLHAATSARGRRSRRRVVRSETRVFWHSDVVHAVENEHKGHGYSNVMYIAATVGCEKNSSYMSKQAPAFLSGKTPSDFAPDDFEADFIGPAEADLTALGESQMYRISILESYSRCRHPLSSF